MARRFLEKHAGCPPDDAECMGPVGEYWTLFGTHQSLLWIHALGALALVALLGGTLAVLHKLGKVRATPRALTLVTVLSWPVFFLALAYFFPITIVY